MPACQVAGSRGGLLCRPPSQGAPGLHQAPQRMRPAACCPTRRAWRCWTLTGAA